MKKNGYCSRIKVAPVKSCFSNKNTTPKCNTGVDWSGEALMNIPENEFQFDCNAKQIAAVTNERANWLGKINPYTTETYIKKISSVYKSAADLEIFNIELNTGNLHEIEKTIVCLQSSFSGVLLTGINNPACYQLQNLLKQEMTIPVISETTGIAVALGAVILNATKIKKKQLNEMRFLSLGSNLLKISALQHLFLLGADPSMMFSSKNGGFEYASYASMFTDVLIVFDFQIDYIRRIVMELPAKPILVFLNRNLIDYISGINKLRPDALIITLDSTRKNGLDAALSCPYLLRAAMDQMSKHITPAMLKSASISLADLLSLKSVTETNRLLPDIMDKRLKSIIDQLNPFPG